MFPQTWLLIINKIYWCIVIRPVTSITVVIIGYSVCHWTLYLYRVFVLLCWLHARDDRSTKLKIPASSHHWLIKCNTICNVKFEPTYWISYKHFEVFDNSTHLIGITVKQCDANNNCIQWDERLFRIPDLHWIIILVHVFTHIQQGLQITVKNIKVIHHVDHSILKVAWLIQLVNVSCVITGISIYSQLIEKDVNNTVMFRIGSNWGWISST